MREPARTIVRHLAASTTRGQWINEVQKGSLLGVPTGSHPPGLSNLKQAQTCTNYCVFVPIVLKGIVRPKPPNEVLDRAKINRKEKVKNRIESKGKEASN